MTIYWRSLKGRRNEKKLWLPRGSRLELRKRRKKRNLPRTAYWLRIKRQRRGINLIRLGEREGGSRVGVILKMRAVIARKKGSQSFPS